MRGVEEPLTADARTVEALVTLATRVLTDSTHIDPDHDHDEDARTLMAWAAGPASAPASTVGAPVAARARERFLAAVARRAAGEPVALITGSVRFCGLDVRVRPGVFVPRPSSEFLARRAAAHLARRRRPVLVDVCTGTGAVALAAAHACPTAEVWGTDLSVSAVRTAAGNARRLGIAARFRVGDLFDALPPTLAGRVDVLSGYLAYLSDEDLETLYTEAREFEPRSAFVSDGPDLLGRVLEGARRWLKPGGWLLLEVDADTGGPLRRRLERTGYRGAAIRTHPESWDVVVEGQNGRHG